MSEIRSMRDARVNCAAPLNTESFAVFAGREVPRVRWLIPGVLVEGGVTLFSGQGGKGKSLLCMQLQVACQLAQNWLGMSTADEPIPSLGLYCEDERDLLHHRMESIRIHYGCTYEDLEGARFVSRVGQPNELMRFWGRKEEGEPTALLRQLREEVNDWGIRLVIIDTVADAFGGNENIRPQVRAFVGALRNIVLNVGGGVILNAHPSRAGLSDGSGLSGSTAWEASVRARINLTEPRKPDSEDQDDQEPTRERILKVMKNNYGAAGQKWRLAWQDGVFVRTDLGIPGSIVDRLAAKGALLEAARYLVQHGSFLAATGGTKSSLTALARQMPVCAKFSFAALLSAQDALEKEGALKIVELGPKSKMRRYIRPAEVYYPGETPSMLGEPQ